MLKRLASQRLLKTESGLGRIEKKNPSGLQFAIVGNDNSGDIFELRWAVSR